MIFGKGWDFILKKQYCAILRKSKTNIIVCVLFFGGKAGLGQSPSFFGNSHCSAPQSVIDEKSYSFFTLEDMYFCQELPNLFIRNPWQ